MSGVKGRSGGKRDRAGRRGYTDQPREEGQPVKVRKSVVLLPATDAAITANRCSKEPYGATIDRIVREWLATQG